MPVAAEHLAEVRHRRLAAIALPVGVRRKADRGVEREIRARAVIAKRIERQHALQAQDRISEEREHGIEDQHMHRVAAPALLFGGVDARQAVKARFDGPEYPVKRRTAPFIEREEPLPHRLCKQQQDTDERGDQKPSLKCHGMPPLEAFGPREHGDEIEKKAERGETGEPKVECHDIIPYASSQRRA
jgi:hypothetical protein